MGTVFLPHPAQVRAERPWHDHVAGCHDCQEASGPEHACSLAQRLHEDAVQAAVEAHAGVVKAGHEVKLELSLPDEAWRVWDRILGHPAISAIARDATPLAGIDISKWQGGVAFDAAAAGNWYIISKASEGVGYVDPYFARNWSETHRVNRVVGAYHFSRPDLGTSPEAEADFFLSITGAEPGTLLAHDAESAGGSEAWCRAWKEHLLARTGYLPGFYSYLSWIQSRGIGGGSALAESWLWLAWPDSNGGLPVPPPWGGVAMQQYGGGPVAGISGSVDLNRFLGSLDQLKALSLGGGDPLANADDIRAGVDQLYNILMNGSDNTGRWSWTTNALQKGFPNDDVSGFGALTTVDGLVRNVFNVLKNEVEPAIAEVKTEIAKLQGGTGPTQPPGPGGSTDLQPALDAIAALQRTLSGLTLRAQGVTADPTPVPAPVPGPAPAPASPVEPPPATFPPPTPTGGT